VSSRQLRPVFTDYIPPDLEDGTLYVSMEYATASHLCACGCGWKVVTPLDKVGWTLRFDGSVSLEPSIGNGQFPCGSHYWIRNDSVVWSRRMSQEQAGAVLCRDDEARQAVHAPAPTPLWKRLLRRLGLGR